MKTRLRRTKKKDDKEMFTLLQETWDALTEESINSLVQSFTERCKMVLALGGQSLSPYLSSHRAPALPDDDPVWDDDLDRRLFELVETYGQKWDRVAGAMGIRPTLAKYRHRLISQARQNCTFRQREILPPISDLDVWAPHAPEVEDWLASLALVHNGKTFE